MFSSYMEASSEQTGRSSADFVGKSETVWFRSHLAICQSNSYLKSHHIRKPTQVSVNMMFKFPYVITQQLLYEQISIPSEGISSRYKMAEIGGFHVLASLCACAEPEINKMSLKNAWSQMACAAHTSLLGKGFVHHSRDNQLYNDLTLSLRSRVRI